MTRTDVFHQLQARQTAVVDGLLNPPPAVGIGVIGECRPSRKRPRIATIASLPATTDVREVDSDGVGEVKVRMLPGLERELTKKVIEHMPHAVACDLDRLPVEPECAELPQDGVADNIDAVPRLSYDGKRQSLGQSSKG